MRDPVRTAALGGVIGPTGFISAWVIGAAATSAPYSSIDDAISRLAAVGSDTRWLMTAGFVTFGLSLPLYAWALRSTVPGRAWITATATGLGHRRLALSGIAAGLMSALALALTITGLPTGLFQRVGLTVSDAWIIATALAIRRGAILRAISSR